MDGSQKLPQRLLGTIRDRLSGGTGLSTGWRSASPPGCAMSPASTSRATPIDVKDPLAARLRAIADAAGPDAAKLADGLLAVGEVFGADLSASPDFRRAVTDHVASLLKRGAVATIAAVVAEN